jgi:hypothetical protein
MMVSTRIAPMNIPTCELMGMGLRSVAPEDGFGPALVGVAVAEWVATTFEKYPRLLYLLEMGEGSAFTSMRL